MRLLPKSIHRCRRYPTKFNSGRDIPSCSHGIASELLQGPLRGRLRGHVHVENPARTDFHHDEDIEELEPRRDNGQEVGGDDRLRMIANECGR